MNQEEQNQQIQELFLLQRVAQRISSIIELDFLLEEIVGDVAETFGYTRSGVLLKDDVTNELVIAAVHGWTKNYHLKGERFKIGEYGIVGHVAATGETYYAPDVTIDPYYQVSEELTRSEVDIPLKIRGRLLGVFSTQHNETDAFSPERIQLLEALAGHIAAAIENARRFHRERLEKQRALVELDKAHDIKHSLSPKQSPIISQAASYKKAERKKWEQVKEIFDAALKLAPDEREQFLAENCSGDEELRREVQSLLSSFDSANSFLQKPAVGEIADVIESGDKKLENGKRFGYYRIIKQIGAGGMGEVYLAKDTKLERKVALKILPETLAQDNERMRRFVREAKSASALNHPNIITIYEIGETDNTHFIAAEYIEGETLHSKLKMQPLNFKFALDVAIQVVSALDAAHRAGIIHRDIKPENVMVRPDGFVKLLDFGIAKLTEKQSEIDSDSEAATAIKSNTAPGMIIGTANYMSPEQAIGKQIDARTDIFSFGVVFYEMLTSERAFDGETPLEIISSILKDEPKPILQLLPELPGELERIAGKTLRKDRDERYQTSKNLLADLKECKQELDFQSKLESRSRPNKQKESDTQSFKAVFDEKSQSLPPNNLTENLSPLIGREKEIAEIKNLLLRDDVRLLTMTGIGGTGKTTLARAVARALLKEFSDGVFFSELAAITNAEFVISTIALSLGLKEAGGKPILEMLKDYLRDKQVLIVVDNFEQVIDAAPQIAELVSAASRVKILITSRTLLHLSAEREFVVPPLAVPADVEQVSLDELQNYEAIKLFVERARNVKSNFALTDENARSVAEICAQLDGLPLAIELAAARVKILSPQMILAKLENRLKLLTGGASDLPARQQTMRGAVEWSYDLLNEEEETLFRRLAVFAGGFTFEAAEAVVQSSSVLSPRFSAPASPEEKLKFGVKTPRESETQNLDVLDLITSLVDKSLLVSKAQTDDETRFRMLKVVREYALDRLEASDEAEAMRRRYAAYFLALAEEAEPHLQGAQPAEWLKRLEEEHDNLREVLRWSSAYDAATAGRLAAAIRYFWDFRGYLMEGLKWSAEVLKLGDGVPPAARRKILNMAGNMARFQGDYETARVMYEEGLKEGRAAGDLPYISLSYRGLGGLALEQGDRIAARRFVEEALSAARKSNDKLGIARSLSMLGDLARVAGDDAAALSLFEEALEICRQLDNKYATGNILNNLAAAEYGEGDDTSAYAHFAEGLRMLQESGDKIGGDKIGISYALDGFAALAVRRGESELAARLAGAAEHLRESINYNIETAERRFRDAYLAELKTKMNEADFAKAYEQGRNLKLEEAIALALAETGGETETEGDRKLQGKATNETGEAQAARLSPATTDAQETPANVTKPESQVSTDKPKTKQNLLLIGLLSLIVLTAGFFAYRYFTPNSKQIESIAVLPFVNESGNQDVEYLSDGMTETLISSLSQIPKLNVKARSSVFRYKGKEVDLQKIAQELNVQAILNGRVVQRGQDLTLYLELVDANTGNRIWGDQYNRKTADLVALQSEIARDVSQKLKTKLSGADEQRLAKNYTENSEAYNLYLQGRFYVNKRTPKDSQKAVEYFDQAIAADPNYALAFSGLADAYALHASYGGASPREAMPKAREAALKALSLDNNLAEAHAALGLILHSYDYDFTGAERELKRAIELNSNYAAAHHQYAQLLSLKFGRHEEAFAEYRRALEIDPLSLIINRHYGESLFFAGRYDAGLAQLQKTVELDANFASVYAGLAILYQVEGNYAESVEAQAREQVLFGNAANAELIRESFAMGGWKEFLRVVTEAREPILSPMHNTAVFHAELGNKDKAFAELNKAYENRQYYIALVKVDPRLDPLRNDPRFQELLRKVGFPE